MIKLTARKVIQNFQNKGFNLLGIGCYASVFESNTDPNLVYKIGVNRRDPWLEYIKTNVKSNYFPKIYSIHHYYDGYLCLMERLYYVPYTLEKEKKKLKEFSCKEAESVYKVIKGLVSDTVRIDLHDGNIMMRANRQLVITDPLAETYIDSGTDLENWQKWNSNGYSSY